MATIEWIGFYNIGDTEYCAALQDDGSVLQIPTAPPNTPVAQIMPPGTIMPPSPGVVSGWTILGFAQFGSQYLLFSKDQSNGYWIWDGHNLYTAGTLNPNVQLTAPGKNYSSAPTINIVTTGGGGGVNLIAARAPGTDYIEQVTFAAGGQGSGFGENDFTAAYVTGGGSDDQAMGRGNITPNSGGVIQVVVVNPGAGYTYLSVITFSGGGGSGTAGIPIIENGAITGVTIITPGTGYTTPPAVGETHGSPGTGIGFVAYAVIGFGQVTSITIVNQGTNYLTPPTVKIIGDGTGATAVAQLTSGQVSGFTMQNYGTGYTVALALCEGGNNAANITVNQMPFGISGTAIEIYQSRVWIANGAAAGDQFSAPPLPPKDRVVFSVAGDPGNFDPTQGAGAFRGNNSFLRVGYHSLKQVNGFLYLVGDSSLDYISGVVTQSTTIPGTNPPVAGPPTTTFNLQNADPAIGSPWPSSALIFNRKLIFANSVGVFEAPGGAVKKVSLPLDGFYATDPAAITALTANFPAAQANIYGIPVYMLLLPVVDVRTGILVNKLLMWSGENWFTSQQSKNLTYIASQEVNTTLIAWGTDGSTIFPLFQSPSTAFQKSLMSKLYGNPLYLSTKSTSSLHAILEANAIDGQPVNVYLDSERMGGSGAEPAANVPTQLIPGATQNTVIDQNGNTYPSPPPLVPPVVGAVPGPVYGPITVGQQGRFIGFTVTTNASDLELLSIGLAERVESPNV